MKNVVTILVFSCILFINHAEAQYSQKWYSDNGYKEDRIISIENTDADPQKEILVGYRVDDQYNNGGSLILLDGLTGDVEWKSSDIFNLTWDAKLIDANGDGIFEILFYAEDNDYNFGWYLYSIAGLSINEINTPNLQSSNFPNPFKQSTTIKYSVSENGTFVSLKIFDSYGTELKTLVNEKKNAGEYEILFNGLDLSSGMYFYQINIGNEIGSKKMIKME